MINKSNPNKKGARSLRVSTSCKNHSLILSKDSYSELRLLNSGTIIFI